MCHPESGDSLFVRAPKLPFCADQLRRHLDCPVADPDPDTSDTSDTVDSRDTQDTVADDTRSDVGDGDVGPQDTTDAPRHGRCGRWGVAAVGAVAAWQVASRSCLPPQACGFGDPSSVPCGEASARVDPARGRRQGAICDSVERVVRPSRYERCGAVDCTARGRGSGFGADERDRNHDTPRVDAIVEQLELSVRRARLGGMGDVDTE